MVVSPNIPRIEPPELRIQGCRVLPRVIHHDPRGFLVETMRSDDREIEGDRFAMSYTSVTVPGQFRDRHQWHLHRRQVDRFVVPLGEMTLVLFDARPDSPSRGTLSAIRMRGAPYRGTASPSEGQSQTTHLITIPPGVCHVIGNLHPSDPFVLVNYPTQLYDPSDEGRRPFSEVPVPTLGGTAFDWDRVQRDPP